MKSCCEILEWDSNFFGYRVGKVQIEINGAGDLNKIFKSMHSQECTLAYYSSKNKLPALLEQLPLLDIVLVDKKTTFIKRVNFNDNLSNASISFYEDAVPDKYLLQLAIQAGKYSRFYTDKKIGAKKGEELYRLWMTNSVNKKIAKEVLVFNELNKPAGFVTVGDKNGRGDIGIIAVDENFRGKGIGKILMLEAENWFFKNEYKNVQVVTQGDNIAACNLYTNCGYEIESVEFFYHIRLEV